MKPGQSAQVRLIWKSGQEDDIEEDDDYNPGLSKKDECMDEFKE